MFYLSCICSKGLDVSAVYNSGRCVQKEVTKSESQDTKVDLYINLINSFKQGLKLLRNELSSNLDDSCVVIETNNSVMKKWFERGYATIKYADKFFELLEVLDDMPVTYKVVYVKSARCKCYADKKYIKREKLTGIE